MTFVLKKQAGVFVPSGGVDHLFVILTEKDKNNIHLWVNITSVPDEEDDYYDTACVLEAGCHKFVTHESYVYYQMGESAHHLRVLDLIKKKHYRECNEPISDELFARIVAGLKDSDAPRWFKEDYRRAVKDGR